MGCLGACVVVGHTLSVLSQPWSHAGWASRALGLTGAAYCLPDWLGASVQASAVPVRHVFSSCHGNGIIL